MSWRENPCEIPLDSSIAILDYPVEIIRIRCGNLAKLGKDSMVGRYTEN